MLTLFKNTKRSSWTTLVERVSITCTHLMHLCIVLAVGLISRELAPYSRSILGVDISQAMVDQYNLRVFNQGIPPEEMRAVCAELEGKEGELGGQKFDVIVVSCSSPLWRRD